MQEKSTSDAPTKVAIRHALLSIVGDRGIDQVSVRTVASTAGVSIGTVQHHFPTKDAMLLDAYENVVDRIRLRIAGLRYGSRMIDNVMMVAKELLPLDTLRASEVRLHVAFSARAMNTPALANVERLLLSEIHRELADVLMATWQGEHSDSECMTVARAVLGLTDGIAAHAVSSDGLFRPEELVATVGFAITALISN